MPEKLSIDQLIDKAGSLPPVPMVLQKALQIIQDPNSNMADLAKTIKLDQAMAGLLLRWVNSGYYSLSHELVTIEQAVTYLGFRTVQNLVLSASVASFMNRPIKGYALDKGDLWKHSFGTAAGARLIIKDIAPEMMEQAYYGGLFCDIGKLVFDKLLQESNLDVDENTTKSFDELEQELFGYDHASISAAIVRRWNFPAELSTIVELHHTPYKLEGKSKAVGYAVHVADSVMTMFGVGIGRDSLQYNLDPATEDVLHWNERSLDQFYERVLPLLEEANAFLRAVG